MNEHEMYCKAVQFLKDYDSYLDDHHLTMDTIAVITCEEARNVLRNMRGACPHNLAKAMATEIPLDADRWDEIEHRVQEQLPFEAERRAIKQEEGRTYSL